MRIWRLLVHVKVAILLCNTDRKRGVHRCLYKDIVAPNGIVNLICKRNKFFLFMKRGDVVQDEKGKDHQRRAASPRMIVKQYGDVEK
jgi:hypothetical protein